METSGTTRGVSADGRYECFYCVRGEAMKEAGITVPSSWVLITLHDRRGCYHLCWAHAHWRSQTSAIGGHSDDCPHKGQ